MPKLMFIVEATKIYEHFNTNFCYNQVSPKPQVSIFNNSYKPQRQLFHFNLGDHSRDFINFGLQIVPSRIKRIEIAIIC